MINDARGSHVSPGIYMNETDINYSVKTLGITSLGLAGETLKGPAFEDIKIEKWSEFEDYFGGTSSEKFKGSGYPKYELPYIAKEYLKESKELHVVRVLGLSGYDAGKAWAITANKTEGTTESKYVLAVIRSKAEYDAPAERGCEPRTGDTINFLVKEIGIKPYKKYAYTGDCTKVEVSGESETLEITADNLGKFTLVVEDNDGVKVEYPISLNYGDKDYIFNVLPSDPLKGDAKVYVEEFYDYALKILANGLTTAQTLTIVTGETISPATNQNNYKSAFDCAKTPWIVSQVQSDGNTLAMKKLFRVYTISDGKAANKQVKISIQNIKPDEGTFDLLVRAQGDSDSEPNILEKFSACNLIEGSKNYLPVRVGTVDGSFLLNSKYISIEMGDGDISGLVPCGFLGFPQHNFTGCLNMPIAYNTTYDSSIKPKRQYFGLSDKVGVDEDILSFKGVPSSALTLSNGFHLDSILNQNNIMEPGTEKKVLVDGATGYTFEAVNPIGLVTADNKIPRIISEEYAKGTIYEDVRLRKFTVYPYGGFDGWDIYREERTNGDAYRANKYAGQAYDSLNVFGYLDLPSDAINSDYYAYLGGYRQFANPEKVDINIFATPGIDFINNQLLVEDALDVIEDTDDGRRGDCIYVFNTPNKPKGYGDTEDEMYTADEIADYFEDSNIDSSYAATYWPWVKIYDSSDNKYVNLPVTKDVVRNMAYTDNTSYPWFSPAGVLRGNVNCVKACKNLKIGEEDILYENSINPIKTFAVDGVKVWGNKTAYSVDSPLNRINVRRLMLRVKKLVNATAKQLIFDQYDATLKTQFLSLVNPILADVKANRGISDYRIDVEDSAEARDAHILPATIHIKPTPSLEYISINFTIYPESVDFVE